MNYQKGLCVVGKDKVAVRDDCVLPDYKDIVPTGAIIKPVIWAPCTTDAELAESGCSSLPYMLNKAGGHEMCGLVEYVGPEVTDFKVGDRVIVCGVMPKWRSLEAQNGHGRSFCDNMYFGVDYPDRGGSFVEHYYIRDADMNLAHIPENVTWEQAVFVPDMMQTPFMGVEEMEIRFGQSVAVIGIGPVGLGAVRACYLRGAGKIFAVGHRDKCKELALEYGASKVFDYTEVEDLKAAIVEANGGQLLDSVITCGGPQSLVSTAMSMLRPGGICVNLSVFYGQGNVELNYDSVGWGYGDKTLKFIPCNGGRLSMSRLVSLIEEGHYDPTGQITHRFYGMEKIEDALNMFINKDRTMIKPVIYNCASPEEVPQ